MKGLDRLVDMSRYRPTLTSSLNCTPEPSTAGSMRSPMAARNAVVGERALGSSSTAVPTPMGRSMQIVVPGGVDQVDRDIVDDERHDGRLDRDGTLPF